ncbi:MAG: DUF1579 family protein [Armatimonadetes bacterium]|nr:DUF1579 family protein [Armatimonadota bacterium]
MVASLGAIIVFANAFGQEPAKALDFWVGEWKLEGRSRVAPGKDEWTPTKATNTIKKTLSGKVIEENFATDGYNGRSWSMFDPKTKSWNQSYVDDSGAYLLFKGGPQGDTFVFEQTNIPADKPKLKMRMVFLDIKPDSFKWHWMSSKDKGKTWENQWELNYTRIK